MNRRARIALWVVAVVVSVPLSMFLRTWLYLLGAGRVWDKAEPEVHLLPPGFIGPVVIMLDDSSAREPERESGARLFRIPVSGVTRSRLPVNRGWGRPDYFYLDSAGHRSRIVGGLPCDDSLPGDPVEACLMGHTNLGGLPDRAYEAYLVGSRADRIRWRWRDERFVDSVVYGRLYPPVP